MLGFSLSPASVRLSVVMRTVASAAWLGKRRLPGPETALTVTATCYLATPETVEGFGCGTEGHLIHSCVEGEGRQQLPALAAGGGPPQWDGGGCGGGGGLTERVNSEEPDHHHHHHHV